MKTALSGISTALALLLGSLTAKAEPAFLFPEEKPGSPELWRPACEDWLDSAPFNRPDVRIDKGKRAFYASTAFSISPEPGETPDELLASVESLLSDGMNYPQWVLPGINDRVGGGEYFVTLNGLSVREALPRLHFLLTGPYGFQVLWFKREGASTLEMRVERGAEFPPCAGFALRRANAPQPNLKLSYRMTPRPEIIEAMLAEIYVVPKTVATEVHLRLATRPSRLVHELMSESMLRSQVQDRGLRIFSNFVDERRQRYLRAKERRAKELAKMPSASSAAPKPSAIPSKRAVRPKRAP
jgi:hypothetical protein